MEKSIKKVNYKRAIELSDYAYAIDIIKKDKLSYYVARFKDFLKSHIDKYNSRVNKINVDLCSIDKDTNNLILDDKGNCTFTKENSLERLKRIEELKNEEIELSAIYCPDLSRIKTLDATFILTLNGFLFDLNEEQLEALFCEDGELQNK